MGKHRHAEFIKAWADGQDVQRRTFGDSNWLDFCTMAWFEDADQEFRIKPKEKVARWLWAFFNPSTGNWELSKTFLSDFEVHYDVLKQAFEHKKLEFTRMEFDE
jgi:hypothetical protein